jgi:hypothetical protein
MAIVNVTTTATPGHAASTAANTEWHQLHLRHPVPPPALPASFGRAAARTLVRLLVRPATLTLPVDALCAIMLPELKDTQQSWLWVCAALTQG